MIERPGFFRRAEDLDQDEFRDGRTTELFAGLVAPDPLQVRVTRDPGNPDSDAIVEDEGKFLAPDGRWGRIRVAR
jgi:hypothetical protein